MGLCFPSKKSSGLGLFLWITLAGSLFANYYAIYVDFNTFAFVLSTAIWVPTLVFIGVIWIRINYIVDYTTRSVKIGPITYVNIEIEEILSIQRTRSIISAPATSFDRIEIRYKNGEVVISPMREDEFVQTLVAIKSSIELKL
jgi:hypothetical protein